MGIHVITSDLMRDHLNIGNFPASSQVELHVRCFSYGYKHYWPLKYKQNYSGFSQGNYRFEAIKRRTVDFAAFTLRM